MFVGDLLEEGGGLGRVLGISPRLERAGPEKLKVRIRVEIVPPLTASERYTHLVDDRRRNVIEDASEIANIAVECVTPHRHVIRHPREPRVDLHSTTRARHGSFQHELHTQL